MKTGPTNVDLNEVERFNALASRWWDPAGEMRMLHRMNPVRLAWIGTHAPLAGAHCLDVGCGAGLLSEGLARAGAEVTAIDLAADSLTVARLHQAESGLASIRYLQVAAEELAAQVPATFDVVTCLEMLEHVPDPASTVHACAALARPGGSVFFSTLNRNPKAYLFAVIGAEYVLKLLPRGTHDYAKFIRPAELARYCREAGLQVEEITGMSYNPFTKTYALGGSSDVNYLLRCRRDG